MNEPVRVGHDPDENRALYVTELSAWRLEGFHVPSERFGCFLVADATDIQDEAIRTMVRVLLDAGASYFVIWGPGCRHVEDVIDKETPVEDEPHNLDVVITISLADMGLEEAIWQSVYIGFPAGRYETGCRALVAIVVNHPVAAAEIRRWYADLRGLCATVEGEDDEPDEKDAG
jgi:hypothetical protein